MDLALESGLHVASEELEKLAERFQIRTFSLFGSAVRGELGPESDIDILVEFEPNHSIGLLEFGRLEEALSELFGRKVDLVSRKSLSRHIGPRILQEARLFYGR